MADGDLLEEWIVAELRTSWPLPPHVRQQTADLIEHLQADLAKAREEADSSRRVTVAAGKIASDYLQRIAELEAALARQQQRAPQATPRYEWEHSRDCAYVTAEGPAACSCEAGKIAADPPA